MVQVLPETSNQNIWRDIASQAFEGYEEARSEKAKSELFRAANDETLSPMDRSKAMVQYIGKHGKVEDLIKFQKEQGRQKALINFENLLRGGQQENVQNPNQNAPTGVQNPGVDLNNIGNPPANGSPQMNGPIQNAEQLFNAPGKIKPPQEVLNKALLNLAQYDAPMAKTIGDIFGREQKEEIAAKNQAIKEKEIALKERSQEFKEEETRRKERKENAEKIDVIQETSSKALKAAEKQLQSIDTISELNDAGQLNALSAANISELLSTSENPIMKLIGKAIQTPAGAAFKTAAKQLFTGLKDLWGAKPTENETKIYTAMHAEVGRNKLANDASLTLLRQPLEQEVEEHNFTQKLIGENPDITVRELQYQRFNHMQEFKKQQKAIFNAKVDLWAKSKIKPPAGTPVKPNKVATGRPSLEEIYGS